MSEIQRFPNLQALSAGAAEVFVAQAAAAIHLRGQFCVALSGGSTPRTLYTLLASEAVAPSVDWINVHVFWGDERCVPPDHPDSDYRMARETLLDHVPIPEANIHRMRGEIEPQEAAREYGLLLRDFFPRGDTRFDLILLGLGDDGHTASLFPGTDALDETQHRCVANYVEKLSAWRITLTPLVLNAALLVVFLVSGASKADALSRTLKGPYQPRQLPAQLVRPTEGRLVWMVDDAAASMLS